jgi:transposase
MANEFWLNDAQWAAIEAYLPTKKAGAHRVDDRRVISGIIHVMQSSCRWRDCPSVYGPHKTVYNRWNRWSGRPVWRRLFAAICIVSPDDDFSAIKSAMAMAHRSPGSGKGGGTARRSRRC